MQLEDYFDFLAPNDVRIKGTRIGIEHILYEHIHCAESPEAIAEQFHTVTLEQVYATILYYLHNQQEIEKYVADWLECTLKAQAEQDQNPPLVVARLRQLKAERASISSEHH